MVAPARCPGRRRGDRGWALFVALVVTLLLSLAAALVAAHLWTRTEAVRRQAVDLRLQALVDSGLALAMATISGARYASAEGEEEIGRGSVLYRVTVAGSGLRDVELEATYGGLRRRGAARVRVPNPVDPVQLVRYRSGPTEPADPGMTYSAPIVLPPPPPVD